MKKTLVLGAALLGLSTGVNAMDYPETRDYVLDGAIEVYFGGFAVARIDWETEMHQGHYKAQGGVTPVGIASYIFGGKSHSEVNGEMTGLAPQPGRFIGRMTEDEETQEATIVWDESGPISIERSPDEVDMPVAEQLAAAKGTVDPLTAAIFDPTFLGGGELCNGSRTIFDGNSIFELKFEPVRESQLKASRYNIYDGWAMRCDVTFTPIWSADAKSQERLSSVDDGRKARLWVGRLPAPDGGPDLLVPARVEVVTTFGTVVAHLVEANVTSPSAVISH